MARIKTKAKSSKNWLNRRRMRILGFLAGVLMVIMVAMVAIVMILEAELSAEVEVLVAPRHATALIGEVTVRHGKKKLAPGNYEYRVEAAGFETFRQRFEIKAGEKIKLYHAMKPQAGNEKWYEKNPEDAAVAQQITDAEAEEQRKAEAKEIYGKVPFYSYDLGFAVQTRELADGKLGLKVRLLSCDEQRVKGLRLKVGRWLEEQGIDVRQYPAEYVYCDGETKLE